jgi:hypothetical protein
MTGLPPITGIMAAVERPDTAKPARKRQRKPTLAGVAKQAAKAGIPVASYTVNADGGISVVLGQPDESNKQNEWDEALRHGKH